ncbi:MAG: hydantoinase/oxoprolinase family protein, partial [Erysipelothrix sp.]|nr:hydantoinase/oxoprolinase family protein [Erysipelothrix sp.]
MKVRIGIDVGGTFTDAAVINDETYELIGSAKVPTTHNAVEGVAKGIKDVLMVAMDKYSIKAEDVKFIAHGTTQATNALLEGDVSSVGIITIGEGLEGIKSKNDTIFAPIELAPNKYLTTKSNFVSLNGTIDKNKVEIENLINELKSDDYKTIVVSEAFSVNDPTNENYVVSMSKEMGLPATATNEISKLYGLKVRTRTAVINASILPRMLETANMTEQSIIDANIEAPLMVMRCDGGVMNIDEVRNRPILTILSGPAAGVAGALMYEKLTDGIFFEVGGTSTDISCVKDGKVMIKYAEVGGHQTYLNSLDVRTVGIGGGSMLQIEDGKVVDTGPRSAHIAGMPYDCYADPSDVVNPVLKTIKPKDSDPDYGYVECDNGSKFCFTVAGAANILGFVAEDDYAYGNLEVTKKIWQPLADSMQMSIEAVARLALSFAAEKNGKVVKELMKDYKLDERTTELIGGGGGSATVVPHLGQSLNMKSRLAKNAPVISTIGVALAMVRELVERGVANPTKEDILAVRKEA